jgi:RecA-family ATPase
MTDIDRGLDLLGYDESGFYHPERDTSPDAPRRNGKAPFATNGHAPAAINRYEGRRVDIAALLAKPPEPTPWRCEGLVADGTLTIVGGKAGDGKSWLALALAVGVARGKPVAGILCEPGVSMIVDGEMGPPMYIERLRDAGIGPEIELRDAMGLDLSKPGDLAWLRGEIEDAKARLVVIDSLRRLVPSKSENESDDMAPVVAAVAKLARDTTSAILLVHHMGDSTEKFYRGSTGIKDQCDALFGLLRDEDHDGLCRLSCRGGKGKMRYAAEPADRWLMISPENGGVLQSEAPEREDAKMPMREFVKSGILAQLPAKTKTEVAKALGRERNDSTLADAWKELERDGKIWLSNGEWRCRVVLRALDHDHDTTSPEEPA